jgi:hypothetical protein
MTAWWKNGHLESEAGACSGKEAERDPEAHMLTKVVSGHDTF